MFKINTLLIGKELHHFPRLNSTNTYAQTLLAGGFPPAEGTVILTDHQFAGKGQVGNTWESSDGKNITLSTIVYPHFLAPRDQFYLSMATSIAVRNFVARYLSGIPVQIKWPNDIYVGYRKIAGLLIQNTISGRKIQASIVGIGININQRQFSSELTNPTSFTIETGKEFNLQELIPAICQSLEEQYFLLKDDKNWDQLQQNYLDNLLNYKRTTRFQDSKGAYFSGTITGINSAGKLLVLINGTEKAFAAKELKFVLNAHPDLTKTR